MEAYEVNILHQLGLNEQKVREHVFRPEHLTDTVLASDQQKVGYVFDHPDGPLGSAALFYRLNTQQLKLDLQRLLTPCTAGYSMQLRRNGAIVFDQSNGFSKMPGDAGQIGECWTSSTPMHVASVSKLITAMALMRVLKYHNISVNAPFWPFLPNYWIKGDSIDQLTFRDLLTHKSGLVIPGTAPGPSDFQVMKNSIAHGVYGIPGYLNINYGLMRILISTIDVPSLFNLFTFFDANSLGDAYWDAMTIAYYSRYVTDNIFSPLGISSSFLHTYPNALAYPWPVTLPGYNSNDLSTMSGCAAWHLSVNDLLAITDAFRRRGTIIDSIVAQNMLDNGFGVDLIGNLFWMDTKLGRIYTKGGFWGDGKSVEQSDVFFLPKGYELVILSNSPFCQPNAAFRNNVLNTINKNIELNILSATVTTLSALGLFALISKSVKVQAKH